MQEFCLRQRASTSVEDSQQIQCYSKVGGWEGGPWMGGWVGGWPLDGYVWWEGGPWMGGLAMVCIVAEPVGGS